MLENRETKRVHCGLSAQTSASPAQGSMFSQYRRRGKPEQAWAEIRRELLRKISARLKKDRLSGDQLKRKAPPSDE